MGFDFSIFNSDAGREVQALDERYVEWLVKERAVDMILHYEKLWGYYCNEGISKNYRIFVQNAVGLVK